MKLAIPFVFTLTLAVTVTFAAPMIHTSESIAPTLAPLVASVDATIIADSYIVVLKSGMTDKAIQYHESWIRSLLLQFPTAVNFDGTQMVATKGSAGTITHMYDFNNFKGYAGKFTPAVLERIRESEDIAYIEHDSLVHATNIALQRNAPWGLARISHREPLGLRTYNKYPHEESGGEGVTVYVIDTGVNIHHVEFGGRAEWGATIPENDEDKDGNGHGTHVAGTIASKTYGVAKKAKIVAVKVLRSNGSGSMSDVLKGVEWAIEAHQNQTAEAVQNPEQKKRFKGSVANMSLGGGKSQSLDDVVNAAVEAGIHFAVAAGNDNRDACDYSPAAAAQAITVAASSLEDERAWFSNHGPCVDIFAPGKDILSTWIGEGGVETNTISGTSMASPHVAGIVAYYLSLSNLPDDEILSPKLMKKFLAQVATKDVLLNVDQKTPNLLIFTNPPTSEAWKRVDRQ